MQRYWRFQDSCLESFLVCVLIYLILFLTFSYVSFPGTCGALCGQASFSSYSPWLYWSKESLGWSYAHANCYLFWSILSWYCSYTFFAWLSKWNQVLHWFWWTIQYVFEFIYGQFNFIFHASLFIISKHFSLSLSRNPQVWHVLLLVLKISNTRKWFDVKLSCDFFFPCNH